MTGRLLRVMSLALAAAALTWLLFWAWRGAPGVGGAGAVAILVVQTFVLAVEFALLPWFNRRDAVPRAGLGLLLRAWVRESVTAWRVFQFHQPWREHAEPDVWPSEGQGRRAVIFVHGFFCNRALWNPWLSRLRAAGVPAQAINLEPSFASIDAYVALIDAAVAQAERATGRPPLLVGHSMGGIAIRAWWRAHGEAAGRRVHHVVTIGSPHHGTHLARFSRAPNARQMRRTSAWLKNLAAAEPVTRRERFTCFYSHCDNIAAPASTAALPGADNRHLPGWPHLAMALAPPVWDEVWRHLDPARDLSGG